MTQSRLGGKWEPGHKISAHNQQTVIEKTALLPFRMLL